MLEQIIEDFVMIWSVVDPIGTIPVFISVTSKLEPPAARSVAIKATLLSSAILLGFIIFGQILLEALSIHLQAFQIGGGIVLFAFAMTMIFGQSKPESELEYLKTHKSHADLAVFPLSVPSIASPGAMMAVVLLTENSKYSVRHQAVTALVMFAVLGITLLLMLASKRIQKMLGTAGASVVSRIMGLILASVASEQVLEGIKSYFNL